MNDRIFVVFNPHAGKGRGAQFVTPVLEALSAAGAGVEHGLTQGPGDEGRLAREAIEKGFERIVAVGGDGTWSHVGNAILDSGKPAELGLVPGGTGCDLAKSLGIPPRDVHACCSIILDGATRAIDVGKIEDRHFLNIAGFGYDVAVLEDSWNVSYLEGSLLYLYCALRQLGSYRGFAVETEADGQSLGRREMLMVIVANARIFGGGFKVAPWADLEDGRLDALSFANMGLGGRASALVRLLLGTHASHAQVSRLAAERLVYRFDSPPTYETDGEWNQARGTELVIECVPRALRVRVPVEIDGILREEVASRALSEENDPELNAAVERLAEAAGGTLDGLVFFGSRRTGAARANVWSAYDVFVIVGRYRPFYQAMRGAGLSGKSAGFMALISRWLPTQYSIRFEGLPVHFKTAVIRTDTFHRETSPRRLDHFCAGRLFQPSRILYARDEAVRLSLVDDLVSAHAETWEWSRPWAPTTFDASDYGCNALGVSMSWEVRPEPPGRAETLWEAQRIEQTPVFEALLGSLAARGEIVPGEADGRWRLARPVSDMETFRWKWYFRRSIVRSTTRWLKHVMSFEGWLDYILRKAQRHSGEAVELTERERRWPLIFLWPRVLRYLRAKKKKGSTP